MPLWEPPLKCLEAFKNRYPLAFKFVDRCLVLFVLFPCVVAYWAGSWVIFDIFLLPDHPAISAWVSVVVGVTVLTLLNYVQFDLTKRFLQPRTSLLNICVKRLYTFVAGFANVLHCRGFWMIQDHYSGVNVKSACFSLIFATILLVCLRCSCNGIGPPLGTAFDEHKSFFIIETRFRVKVDKPGWLFLDALFSVGIIGALVVYEWRGIWTLLDLLLFPDHKTISISLSVGLGYAVCILVDLVQDKAVAFSTYLERKERWWLRLIFEDVYLFIAKVAVIMLWRGIWVFCESVVADRSGPEELSRIWIPVVVGYLMPTLLLHANSFFVLEAVLDGGMTEGKGCHVKISMLENYLQLGRQERVRNATVSETKDGNEAVEITMADLASLREDQITPLKTDENCSTNEGQTWLRTNRTSDRRPSTLEMFLNPAFT